MPPPTLPSGYTGRVRFDENGNMLSRYVIKQIYPGRPLQQASVALIDTSAEHHITRLHDVTWDYVMPVDLGFKPEDVLPAPTIPPGSNSSPPVSVCSRLCGVGEYSIKKEQLCCWECRKCRDNERTVTNNTACEICPTFYWPNPHTNLTTCELIPPDFPSKSSAIVILEISLSVAGIASSILVFAAYVYFRDERIIKAASRELSFLQLVAILLGYITMLVYAAPPTHERCATAFFLFCLTFNWIYAPLLVKAVRIYRIFHSAAKGARQLKVVSPVSQVVLSSTIVLGQVLICVIVTILDHPSARLTQLVRTDRYVELSCDMTLSGMTSFLCYNLTLVLLCSVLAFKTRKLPDNFNESRFISMCVSTTLVIWLAFIPTYLTSSRQYLKTLLLSLALLLNHSVALVFLFVTKIYAVLYRQTPIPGFSAGGSDQGLGTGLEGSVGGCGAGAQLTTTTTSSSGHNSHHLLSRFRTSASVAKSSASLTGGVMGQKTGTPAAPPPAVACFNNRVNPLPT
ncbi:metabotropic glutamate receptor-like [Aplysia californica]|uniref:Metabotropic glutamate receptor-like n=1 Tax=Aplysia californica TaxID=6500 RepID=A0ABM0K8G9_APLCA|nr:metabotropic glutamate receptor-like [Aplysia californica]